jgi:hypothetical protein
MPPKISRHGGPTFEDGHEVKIQRPGIVPGATDKKGGESKSVGSNSEPSSEKPQTKSGGNSASPRSRAQTTESPSNPTDTETSDAGSTDSSTRVTETESAKHPTKRTAKITAEPRKASVRKLSADEFG